MAHKGKVYPYFHARDLSMKPGGYTYLPDKWVWSGILASGTLGHHFVGRTFVLDWYSSVWPYSGDVFYLYQEPFGPFGFLELGIHYHITHDADMASLALTWLVGPANSTRLPIPVAAAFPYNLTSGGVIQDTSPALLTINYPGVIIPKPW